MVILVILLDESLSTVFALAWRQFLPDTGSI